MTLPDEFLASLEILVDRALAEQRHGRCDVADVFGRAAQGILEIAIPDVAYDVAKIASRKGVGGDVGRRLASRLTPVTAAVVSIVWLLRGARAPAIDALSAAFGDDPAFMATVQLLCRRVFEPTPLNQSALPPAPITTTSATRFEAFAPPGR